MMIHEITAQAGKYKQRKRVGRGRASGVGKTSGRGHKGAGSRSGYSQKGPFEGGQMPYFRRIPKRGFTNFAFRTHFWTVNIGDIAEHPSFASGGDVTPEALVEAGLIRDTSRPLKILGGVKGEGDSVSVKLAITAHRFSESARRMVEDAGGTANELGVPTKGDGKPSTKRAKRRDQAAKRRAERLAGAGSLKNRAPEGGKKSKSGKGKDQGKDKADN